MAEQEFPSKPPATPPPESKPREEGWWTARAIFRCDVRDTETGEARLNEGRILCDETIFLLRARSEEEAMARARELAPEVGETNYLNYLGQTVWWTLVDVLQVYDMCCELGEGEEVYSRLFEVVPGAATKLPPNVLRLPRRRGKDPPAEDRNDPS